MAAGSIRYTNRYVLFSSFTRNSWQRAPIVGMGREWGNESIAPSCSSRRSIPISLRAEMLMGGVLTSPCSQRRGLLLTID